jgi:hypothetical protein
MAHPDPEAKSLNVCFVSELVKAENDRRCKEARRMYETINERQSGDFNKVEEGAFGDSYGPTETFL